MQILHHVETTELNCDKIQITGFHKILITCVVIKTIIEIIKILITTIVIITVTVTVRLKCYNSRNIAIVMRHYPKNGQMGDTKPSNLVTGLD